MDNTKYAFVDEFGAFGYDFSNSGCTTHFIISAIIVDRDNLQIVADEVDGKRKFFNTLEELELYYKNHPEMNVHQIKKNLKNGYFANHLGYLSDYIIVEGRGSNKAIKLKDGCETRLRKVLDETRDIEHHSKEQLLAKYTEAFFLLTIFLL